MKLHVKLVAALAVVALGLVPALAAASGPDYAPEPQKPPKTHQPKGHAYGYYCQGKSKKHVQGEKGTEFSRCVAAMKRADNQDLTAKQACKGESRKHVKGEKGTAYSRCVKAVAQMQREKQREERDSATTES